MKKLRFVGVLLTLVMLATTAAPVFADTDAFEPGGAFTNFTVQNLDKTNAANVTVQYVAQNGSIAATVDRQIPAGSSSGFPASESDLPQGFAGSGVVSSDKSIRAFAQSILGGRRLRRRQNPWRLQLLQ